MKTVLFSALALALSLVASGGAGADDKKAPADDQKAFQGSWTLEKFESSDGAGPPEDVLKKTKFVFEGTKMTIDMGEMKHFGEVKWLGDKKPKRLDIVPGDGPDAGKTFAGIYELTGDTLKMCISHTATAPTEFAAKGDKVMLITLKREKK